jgi:hypothetical protein
VERFEQLNIGTGGMNQHQRGRVQCYAVLCSAYAVRSPCADMVLYIYRVVKYIYTYPTKRGIEKEP